MIRLRNQKGAVLLITYIVVLMLMGLGIAFFIRAIGGGRLSQLQNDSLKAFYNAEKAVSYAYFESANAGWTWFTHQWDAAGDLAPANPSPASIRTATDTNFIAAGVDAGCYAANDGLFILKTFPDPQISNVTVVRAKGRSAGVERVLEYRITRSAIFDFAWWTPYDLNLNNVGTNVNGGRIHSNGNIYMYSAKRLNGLDFMSTGKDKSIYYAWSTYYSPGSYDWNVDGSANINGKIPIPHLGTPRRWAGTETTDPYGTQNPWKYQWTDKSGNSYWSWRSYGYEYAGQWPPRDWYNEEAFFSGDSQSRYNDPTTGFNNYNTWIYPAKKDAQGNILFDASGKNVILKPPQQIPAELPGAMWDWTKYNSYASVKGSPQQQLRFTVYDSTGAEKYVEDTLWKIVNDPTSPTGKNVLMTNLTDPSGVTYWDMLQDSNYWQALGYSAADAQTYSTHINPEVIDGTYGSEVPAGQTTIQVDNTNSLKQPGAWDSFLSAADLKDVLLTNQQGEDMEAPRFATTYKKKSENAGLYLSSKSGTYTLHYGNGQEVNYTLSSTGGSSIYCTWASMICSWCTTSPFWCSWCTYYSNKCTQYSQPSTEQVIDKLVERLNTDAAGDPLPAAKQSAKKVKFINTYTNKQNIVLEIDLDKMDKAEVFPANGIIYSEVPIRLTNGEELPSTGDPKADTFNVISTENIYLKGNYNNPNSDVQWMPAAIISKKQIYSLSKDFNDPQVTPASLSYPNYPYVYVKTDASGNLIEANPNTGAGSWVLWWNFDAVKNPIQRTQAINLMNAIQSDWQNTFDKNDPTGSNQYTVSSSHPIIDGKTYGAMPNRVQQNQTYNSLIASYYNGSQAGIPQGVILERWLDNLGAVRSKLMNGAYFQLEDTAENDPNRFVAHASDGATDFFYTDLINYRGTFSWPYYVSSPALSVSYDNRFRNPLLAQSKPIFFGGGESSWREIPLADF